MARRIHRWSVDTERGEWMACFKSGSGPALMGSGLGVLAGCSRILSCVGPGVGKGLEDAEDVDGRGEDGEEEEEEGTEEG